MPLWYNTTQKLSGMSATIGRLMKYDANPRMNEVQFQSKATYGKKKRTHSVIKASKSFRLASISNVGPQNDAINPSRRFLDEQTNLQESSDRYRVSTFQPCMSVPGGPHETTGTTISVPVLHATSLVWIQLSLNSDQLPPDMFYKTIIHSMLLSRFGAEHGQPEDGL